MKNFLKVYTSFPKCSWTTLKSLNTFSNATKWLEAWFKKVTFNQNKKAIFGYPCVVIVKLELG